MRLFRIGMAFGILFLCTLTGCGGSSNNHHDDGTHGVTGRYSSTITVLEDTSFLSLIFPDGYQGDSSSLRYVVQKLSPEDGVTLAFTGRQSGASWYLDLVSPVKRSEPTYQKVIRVKRPLTRSVYTPFNVVLTISGNVQILITDSYTNPSNGLAVGYQSSDYVVDVNASETDLAAAIYDILPRSRDQSYIAETSAVVALVGWER
jgi:hypothetical protein